MSPYCTMLRRIRTTTMCQVPPIEKTMLASRYTIDHDLTVTQSLDHASRQIIQQTFGRIM
jgi:hypothetical protein